VGEKRTTPVFTGRTQDAIRYLQVIHRLIQPGGGQTDALTLKPENENVAGLWMFFFSGDVFIVP
jgi:hypothetical protein